MHGRDLVLIALVGDLEFHPRAMPTIVDLFFSHAGLHMSECLFARMLSFRAREGPGESPVISAGPDALFAKPR